MSDRTSDRPVAVGGKGLIAPPTVSSAAKGWIGWTAEEMVVLPRRWPIPPRRRGHSD